MTTEAIIRVPIDTQTLDRLRELALIERRATADQAAVIIEQAVRRRLTRAKGLAAK